MKFSNNMTRREYWLLVVCIVGLMVFAGSAFVMTAILAKPFSDFVIYVNNPAVSRPWSEWVFFWSTSIFVGLAWVAIYVGFRTCDQVLFKLLLKEEKSGTEASRT